MKPKADVFDKQRKKEYPYTSHFSWIFVIRNTRNLPSTSNRRHGESCSRKDTVKDDNVDTELYPKSKAPQLPRWQPFFFCFNPISRHPGIAGARMGGVVTCRSALRTSQRTHWLGFIRLRDRIQGGRPPWAPFVSQNAECHPFWPPDRSEWAPLEVRGIEISMREPAFEPLSWFEPPPLPPPSSPPCWVAKDVQVWSVQKSSETPSGSTKNACCLRRGLKKMCFLPMQKVHFAGPF